MWFLCGKMFPFSPLGFAGDAEWVQQSRALPAEERSGAVAGISSWVMTTAVMLSSKFLHLLPVVLFV